VSGLINALWCGHVEAGRLYLQMYCGRNFAFLFASMCKWREKNTHLIVVVCFCPMHNPSFLLDFESGSSAEQFIDGLDLVESKSDLDG
jgi:hypothetical protein